MNDAYWRGYQAALDGNYSNPYPLWSPMNWSWELGNAAGHQVLCAALEHIATHLQD
jgi:hypothetical protein